MLINIIFEDNNNPDTTLKSINNSILLESQAQDCNLQESFISSNILPNSIDNSICDISLSNIGCDEYEVIDYSFLNETEQRKPLVPYESSSDDENEMYKSSEDVDNIQNNFDSSNSDCLFEQRQEDETQVNKEIIEINNVRKRNENQIKMNGSETKVKDLECTEKNI